MLPGIHSLIENLAIPYFLFSRHSCLSSTFSSLALPSSIAEVSSVFLSCTFSLFLILRIKSSANITKKKGKQGRGLSSVREDRVFNFIHAERQEGYFSASTVLHFSPTGSSRSYSPCPSLLCNRTVLSLSYLTIGDGDDSFQRRRRLPGYPVKDEEKTFH